MPQTLDLLLAENLKWRVKSGAYVRPFRPLDTEVLVDFSSNDYLGMTSNKEFRQRYLKAMNDAPQILGSTGSRQLSGATFHHENLERELAAHMGSQDALLYSTGWEANVSYFGCVPQKHDWIIYDELMHSSVFVGFRLCAVPKKQMIKLRHNSIEHLNEILRTIKESGALAPSKGPKPTIFLVTETIFSMDGDFGLLPELLDTMDKYVPFEQQCNFVDEAHSTGLFGDGGRGVCWALGPKYRDRIHVRLMTFGKAAGCAGSALFLSSMQKLYISNSGKSVIFSTAPSHNLLISIKTSWDMLKGREGDALRQDYYDSIVYFNGLIDDVLADAPAEIVRRVHADKVAFPAEKGTLLPPCPPSGVICLATPDTEEMYEFCLDRGYIVSPIIPPAVPKGDERTRLCIRAGMDRKHFVRLAEVIKEYIEFKKQDTRTGRHGAASSLEAVSELIRQAKL